MSSSSFEVGLISFIICQYFEMKRSISSVLFQSKYIIIFHFEYSFVSSLEFYFVREE